MSKTAILTLRVNPKLKKQLANLASDDKRSLNSYVEIVLEIHIALEKQKSGGKK